MRVVSRMPLMLFCKGAELRLSFSILFFNADVCLFCTLRCRNITVDSKANSAIGFICNRRHKVNQALDFCYGEKIFLFFSVVLLCNTLI